MYSQLSVINKASSHCKRVDMWALSDITYKIAGIGRTSSVEMCNIVSTIIDWFSAGS